MLDIPIYISYTSLREPCGGRGKAGLRPQDIGVPIREARGPADTSRPVARGAAGWRPWPRPTGSLRYRRRSYFHWAHQRQPGLEAGCDRHAAAGSIAFQSCSVGTAVDARIRLFRVPKLRVLGHPAIQYLLRQHPQLPMRLVQSRAKRRIVQHVVQASVHFRKPGHGRLVEHHRQVAPFTHCRPFAQKRLDRDVERCTSHRQAALSTSRVGARALGSRRCDAARGRMARPYGSGTIP